MKQIQINSSVDLSVSNDYYWGLIDNSDFVRTPSVREILDNIDIKEIEQYLREKKLKNLRDKDE